MTAGNGGAIIEGQHSFTYNTIAFTAIAEYAITATANLLVLEQGYPCELVIGSPTGRACGGKPVR